MIYFVTKHVTFISHHISSHVMTSHSQTHVMYFTCAGERDAVSHETHHMSPDRYIYESAHIDEFTCKQHVNNM